VASAKATRNQRGRRRRGLAAAIRMGMVRITPPRPED